MRNAEEMPWRSRPRTLAVLVIAILVLLTLAGLGTRPVTLLCLSLVAVAVVVSLGVAVTVFESRQSPLDDEPQPAAPAPTPRWLRLTPGYFLLGLLALEGFLLLSEHYCWFSFNQQKGWTVLIAFEAIVGTVLLLTLLWSIASLFYVFRFSLRSLLVLEIAFAIPCGWLAVEMKRAQRQQEAVAAIVGAHGAVGYGQVEGKHFYCVNPFTPIPEWPLSLLGVDYFYDVVQVSCQNSTLSNDAFARAKGLESLRQLWIYGRQITDNDMAELEGLTYLNALTLDTTEVTDAGLRYLNDLENIEYLGIRSSRV